MAKTKLTPEPFDTEASLRETAEKLREALRSIELHGDGEHGSTLAELARISLALTTTCGELRQHQKAACRSIAAIPLDQLVAHLKTLSETKRRELCREVMGEDDEEPLL